MGPADLLKQAAAALQAGQWKQCEAFCNRVLQSDAGHSAALHLRGVGFVQAGQVESAISDLERVVKAHPSNTHAALFLGRALRLSDRNHEAIPILQSAIGDPNLVLEVRYELARCLSRTRRSREAMAQYRLILDKQPSHANARANLAFALEQDNQLDEARQQATQALELNSGLSLAILSMAAIERRSGSPQEAADRLRSMLESESHPVNRNLAFNQLAQCLEAQHQYAEAFQAWSSANRLLRENLVAARPDDTGSYGLKTLESIDAWLHQQPPETWTEDDPPIDEPIFLVGFPRSGTTLLDRMLSAHPDVEVIEEIELLDEARKLLLDDGRLSELHRVPQDRLESARESYRKRLEQVRQYPEKALVVDKLPLNLAYLFLIRRLFPRARVLFLIRDPRDAVLSCFFQSFELLGAMPYFLDLESSTSYYDRLMRLVSLQLDSLDLAVHELRYEDLVTSFEPSVREVLAFVGARWHEDVLDYRQHAADRSVDTPSYQQVTRPLYQSSLARWKHYRNQLEPVLPTLQQWVERFGYL